MADTEQIFQRLFAPMQHTSYRLLLKGEKAHISAKDKSGETKKEANIETVTELPSGKKAHKISGTHISLPKINLEKQAGKGKYCNRSMHRL